MPLGPEFKLSRRMKSRLKSTIEFSVDLSTRVRQRGRQGSANEEEPESDKGQEENNVRELQQY